MQIRKSLKVVLAVAILVVGIASALQLDRFAVDKSLRYRPLANGWVSGHAELHLKPDVNLVDKIKGTIDSDLVHGRFRPAFFFYVTGAYALSPLVHHRSVEQEARPFNKLVNGDLRLFSAILLASVAFSFLLISLLIYVYSGEVLFSFIPIFFIPLSPSVTSNLLQNYIDSQEIPLVLWLSSWLFFFGVSQVVERKWLKNLLFFASLLFLLLAFLTKETTIVVCVALAIIMCIHLVLRDAQSPLVSGKWFTILSISLGTASILSVMVYIIVTLAKQGYAANYAVSTLSEVKNVVLVLWRIFSKYTINNWYGYLPVCLTIAVLLIKRKEKLGRVPLSQHLALLVLLLLLAYGFLFILIPWQPILIKYIYPSVVFFSFSVAFSFSILTRLAKERFGIVGWLCYLLLIPYVLLFNSTAGKAGYERKYWAETANYGVAIVDILADSIADEVNKNRKDLVNVYAEYGPKTSWSNNIPWAELHLLRILNLDKGLNILGRNGAPILNYRMPRSELSSFRQVEGRKTVFFSNRLKDFQQKKFDIAYVGYARGEKPEQVLSKGKKYCYHLAGQHIDYRNPVKFPEFSLYKYLPGKCPEESLVK